MDKYFKIISSCCYIKEGDRILMLRRNKKEANKTFYRGLGGKAEQGENPIDCIKREVMEEAGINITPIWKGILTLSSPGKKDWEAHLFISDGYTGKLTNCNEGELSWVKKSDLLNLEMPQADKELLPIVFSDRNFITHANYDQEKNLTDLRINKI